MMRIYHYFLVFENFTSENVKGNSRKLRDHLCPFYFIFVELT